MQWLSKSELLEGLNGEWYGPELAAAAKGFSFDTRSLEPGQVFLALRGEASDGHAYLNVAVEKGAAVAVVERAERGLTIPQIIVKDTLKAFQNFAQWHRKRFKGKVIGVTGSCGKTSTKDMLASILGAATTHSTYLNWNNTLGVPYTISGIELDSHQYAVIEAGMNMPGEMDAICPIIAPDIAVITTVAPVHLEYVGTIDDVAVEKAKLGRTVQPDGVVLFPHECLQFAAFREFGTRARVIVPEKVEVKDIPESQCFRYSRKELGPEEIEVTVDMGGEDVSTYRLPNLSKGMLSNTVLAICVARLLSVDSEQIEDQINAWRPTIHRGERYQSGKQFYYVDCYNANPVAMIDAFEAFDKAFSEDLPRLYILGCMGELGTQAKAYHYEVGKQLLLREQDVACVLGVEAQALARGLRDGGNPSSQVIVLENKEAAQGLVKDWNGAIFLKASKPYKLWTLLPEGAVKLERQGIVRC